MGGSSLKQRLEGAVNAVMLVEGKCRASDEAGFASAITELIKKVPMGTNPTWNMNSLQQSILYKNCKNSKN